VPALYQLADQYQVKSAQSGIIEAVEKATFSLDSITALLPKAAALGDAAKTLRALLAHHAAKHIDEIIEMVAEQPQSVQQWGLLEVQGVMRHSAVSSFQALDLAVAWTAGSFQRLSHWPDLQQELQLETLQFTELCSLKERQEVLAVPGLAAALFQESLRRMTRYTHTPLRCCHYGHALPTLNIFD
jgi:hypothetical protein